MLSEVNSIHQQVNFTSDSLNRIQKVKYLFLDCLIIAEGFLVCFFNQVCTCLMLSQKSSLVCLTTNGNPCKFPFKYDAWFGQDEGRPYSKCTSIDKGTLWCSTKNNENQFYEKWDYCDIETCTEGEMLLYHDKKSKAIQLDYSFSTY